MIRVLIVDDQVVIRRGFRLFLESAHDITVVGEATSGAEAVRKARALHANVVLMDVRMPGGDGLTATRELTQADGQRPVAVIIVTAFDLDEYVFGALEAGAAGVLLKDTGPDALADAVRAVARGEGLVASTVARRVIAEFVRRRTRSDSTNAEADVLDAGLTTRELEVVRALAQGLSNAEIGRRLHLVPGTVKAHLTRISTKIGTRDRVQTVIWAFTHGIARAQPEADLTQPARRANEA